MKLSRFKGALVALVLFGSILMVQPAIAGSLVSVTFGGGVQKGFTARTFAPVKNGAPTIKIHTGDTVDLHGQPVFVLPEGIDPLPWKKNNASKPGQKYAPINKDPDKDLPHKGNNAPWKLGPGFILEPAPCGKSTDPCEFDGTGNATNGVLSGGDRKHFFVRFTSNPGSTVWAIGVTGSTLKSALRVKIVNGGIARTTQAQIDSAAEKQLGKERAAATALDTKMKARHTRHRMANGHYRYDAWAGADTDTIALIAFYPHKIKLEKGDKVRWHFSQLKNDLHGVGFNFKKALDIAQNGVVPVCDPGAGSDKPPSGPDCGAGTFELDLLRKLIDVQGDGKFPGGRKSFEGSGIRGAGVPTGKGIAGGFKSYDLKFTKASSDKGFRYPCTIHGSFMDGRIVVTD